VTALFVDTAVMYIGGVRGKWLDNYFAWVLSGVLLVLIAVAIIECVANKAAGSGIPQMKAVMAGVRLPEFLSFRTFVGKVFGMICMLCSGLSLGKEGPFVHLASCIVAFLPYKELEHNRTLRHQFLSAGIAVGVAITFGAPIGGMLFAIEVTATQFTVNNLWKSFFASTLAVLCFKFYGYESVAVFTADASYFFMGKTAIGVNQELPFFVILGLFCGIIGSLYIWFQKTVNNTKKRLAAKHAFFKSNWIYSLSMGFICISIIFATKLLTATDKAVINAMINYDMNVAEMNLTAAEAETQLAPDTTWNTATMADPVKWQRYDSYNILFIIMKFVITAITLSCGVPGGIFTPTFCMGAVFGQLYVSQVIKLLELFGIKDYIQYRGVYSIIGAAGVCGSVTRTSSVAVIVLELNGHLSHAVPTMMCVLASYAISEYIKTQSFFEMLSEFSGLDDKIKAKGAILIRDILQTDPSYTEGIDFLSLEEATQSDLIALVQKHGRSKAALAN
jgi:chloride channel 2